MRIASHSARFVARFAELGLHPGGGHTWMLQRAVGRQAAAAMVLLGESVDGESATGLGLALRCVPDDRLLPAATELGRRAAAGPRPLLARIKESMRATAQLDDLHGAVEHELTAQTWSMQQDFSHERLNALRARIASQSRSDGS